MKLYVFIKKVTLTPEINSKYWGSFGRLLERDLSEGQIMTLLSFFEAAENYRNYVINSLAFPQGQMIRYLKADDNSQESFLFFGLTDPSKYKTIVRDGPVYEELLAKKDALYAMLGWTESEDRVVELESEPDVENFTWTGLPATFSEGVDLFERGVPVSVFFKD